MMCARTRGLPWLVALSALFALTVFGCSARAKTVTLNVRATHPVSVAPIEMEPGATKLVAVGTYKVGKYKSKDLRVLQKMLDRTIPMRGAPEQSFRVHLVVRSFLIVHSNEKGAGLACVAWALTNPQQELVFDEQFYAARDSPPLSVSGIKTRIHEGITKRVHQRAQDVASERPLGSPPEDTYDDFERAASRVPNRFKSELPTIFGGYDKWGNQTGIWRTVSGESGEEFARRCDDIDWYTRLGIARPPNAPKPAPPEAPAPGPAPPSGYPPETSP
jgi:hypothetical protein